MNQQCGPYEDITRISLTQEIEKCVVKNMHILSHLVDSRAHVNIGSSKRKDKIRCHMKYIFFVDPRLVS